MLILQTQQADETEKRNKLLLQAQETKTRRTVSPLEDRLSEERLMWLGEYVANRWNTLYGSLGTWRADCDKWGKEAQNQFEHRRAELNKDGVPKIFQRQNDSLNAVGALAEFFCAQARNDLFGASPWFSARPERSNDVNLAYVLPKHMDYKIRPTNLTETYREGVQLASTYGTAFTKKWWHTTSDEWEVERFVLCQDGDDKRPVLCADGDFVYSDDALTDGQDAKGNACLYPEKDPTCCITGKVEYKSRYFPQSTLTYNNVKSANLHYADIAFDMSATELTLEQTPFYHRFEITVGDARDRFGLTKVQTRELANLAAQGAKSEQRKNVTGSSAQADGEVSGLSDKITLVEGYERLNVLDNGKLKNIYFVACPELKTILKTDYLANVTPKGRFPIHRHRIFPKPWKLIGTGFFEKFAYAQDDIDSRFSRINYHSRKSTNPITGLDTSAIEDEPDEDIDIQLDPDKAVRLKSGAKMDQYVQFAKLPAPDGTEKEQMTMSLQMLQMRTGITSASQGDLTGVPAEKTATGIKALISRSAVLLKENVDFLRASYRDDLDYVAELIYTNQDTDETFAWGESNVQELINLKADAVQGIEMNVEILMTQAQNQFKLEYAERAINSLLTYTQLPEVEKVAARPLFLQAMQALEFAEADTIVRQPVVTLDAILPLLPPELQGIFSQFLASLGVQPGGPGGPGGQQPAAAPAAAPATAPKPSPPAPNVPPTAPRPAP